MPNILVDFHKGPEDHGVIKLQRGSRGTQVKTVVQGRMRLVLIGVHSVQKVPHPMRGKK
jgi:hypothetical protein